MPLLSASRRGSSWIVGTIRSPASPSIEETHRASGQAEKEAWRLARELERERPWDIEYLHACLGPAHIALGVALEAVRSCEEAHGATVELAAPPGSAMPRLVRRLLSMRGHAVERLARDASYERLRFLAATAIAFAALAAYVVRMAFTSRPALQHDETRGTVALALHGEWSTRTRHLLVLADLPVSFIVMLGRLKASPAAVAADWRSRKAAGAAATWINPISPLAALRAAPAMLALVWEGLSSAPAHGLPIPFREQVATAFRVLLGAAQFRWWLDRGPRVGTVLFGHTGNADTNALERAMQSRGARCVHVVHGLAAGPNFVGFSDIALFRAGFDARMYGDLRKYGKCDVIMAARPELRRGTHGLFLLTNLAHPMNPRYTLRGPGDELDLLEQVSRIAPRLGTGSRPMRWRPHPVIEQLPEAASSRIRRRAKELGFEETPRSEEVGHSASQARWVFCSPSTVSVDLLAQGILAIVLDPQRSLASTSLSRFPGAREGSESLNALLSRLDGDDAYADAFWRTWDEVLPAAPLDRLVLSAVIG